MLFMKDLSQTVVFDDDFCYKKYYFFFIKKYIFNIFRKKILSLLLFMSIITKVIADVSQGKCGTRRILRDATGKVLR